MSSIETTAASIDLLGAVTPKTIGIIWPYTDQHQLHRSSSQVLKDLDYLFNGLLFSSPQFAIDAIAEQDYFFQAEQFDRPIFLLICQEQRLAKILQDNQSFLLQTPSLDNETLPIAQVIVLREHQRRLQDILHKITKNLTVDFLPLTKESL